MNASSLQQPIQDQRGATQQEAAEAMKLLTRFVCPSQWAAISSAMQGEERQYFFDQVVQLVNSINATPKLYETDGKGKYSLAFLHYFKGSGDWYVIELDVTGDQVLGFGLADMGDPELGYIDIAELQSNQVELDLHWTMRALMDIGKRWSHQ